MKQATSPKPEPFDNLTQHTRAAIEPRRSALEAQKKDIDKEIKALPEAVSDETILYAKAAGLPDLSDCIWRIRSGLTPKQAVEVAALQIFEGKLNEFEKSVEKKSYDEVVEMASKAGVTVHGEGGMSRRSLLIQILKKRDQ